MRSSSGAIFMTSSRSKTLGLADRALHGDTPGRGLQAAGVFGRLVFAGAEFVEIVVAGDVLEGRRLFIGAERAFDGGQFGGGFRSGL
jgi:hypothetical protein